MWYFIISVASVLYTLIAVLIFVAEVQGDAWGSAFGWCNQRSILWIAFISIFWPFALGYDLIMDIWYYLTDK